MIDQWSFKMTIDNLKDSDFDVVKIAVEQLISEKKPLGIAPLYFVSQRHPNEWIRTRAEAGLKDFGFEKEIEEAIKGKTPEDATKALIDKFGNYKR